ncbi:hypothetical protein [Sphingomicrobium marinum]|uniref:hypothetical protein n=1 Tax=Sphingomicrobium marinum TaxID=1227950 RepID=UPI00223EEA5B|nr:hypothetical protein [Sphingomicrobium marinum]
MKGIFARIGNAFRSLTPADWALQFVRFFAVVAGILIAFALDGWNSNRLEQNRQERQLERLAGEAGATVEYLRRELDARSDLLLGWQRLAIALGDNRCPAPDQWPGLHLIDRFPAVTPPSAVSDELIASGGLASLDHPQVREALASYRARLDFFRAEVRARANTTRLIDPGDARFALDYAPSEQEPVIARYDRGALCRDGAFRDRLVLAVRDQQQMANELSHLLGDSVRLCAHLARVRGERCTTPSGPLGSEEEAIAATIMQ